MDNHIIIHFLCAGGAEGEYESRHRCRRRRRTVGQNITKVRQKSIFQLLNFESFLQVYES